MTEKKKTRIHHLLFVAVAAATVFLCTGCFTATVLLDPEFGSRSTYFGATTYTMSPDRREIIATSTKTTNFRYLLSMSLNRPEFISPMTLWSWRSTWEERIPVEPMPDGLMRCFLFVEPDPDAQPYWFHSGGGFEIERPTGSRSARTKRIISGSSQRIGKSCPGRSRSD